MEAKLYAIPGSHPALAAGLMLDHKGIPYRRTDLVTVAHKGQLRMLGFPGVTVPALKIDGRRVQGSRRIAQVLDEVKPDPSLFPPAPERRRAVEEADRWGDEVLQPVPRRISWWALQRDHSAARGYMENANLPLPVGLAARTVGPVAWASARFNGSTDDAVRQDLADLPEHLDHVDALLADGTIGGDELNAADFQIATSVRLLMTFEDLRAAIESRPAGAHALRVAPDYPGHVGSVLPSEWLAPLREAPAADKGAAPA